MGPPRHDVLWTGGFDSTFRVADLVLTHGRRVRPWYVVDPERRTAQREIACMRRLRRLIAGIDPQAGSLLEPTEVVAVADIPPDEAVDVAARAVGSRTPMGAQYSWLARLARSRGLAFELGFEGPLDEDYPLLADAIMSSTCGSAPDDWLALTEAANDADLMTVFGAFRFPIITLTKPQMADLAGQRGFAEVLARTWFCRWPTVLGNACGQCVPCKVRRDSGLAGGVPADTRVRRSLHRAHWEGVRRWESASIRIAAARDALAARSARRRASDGTAR